MHGWGCSALLQPAQRPTLEELVQPAAQQPVQPAEHVALDLLLQLLQQLGRLGELLRAGGRGGARVRGWAGAGAPAPAAAAAPHGRTAGQPLPLRQPLTTDLQRPAAQLARRPAQRGARTWNAGSSMLAPPPPPPPPPPDSSSSCTRAVISSSSSSL
jgi:hypothetical protein